MLITKELTVYYGKACALKRICIEVQAGGFSTIIGANGSGKTTFLRTVSGLKRVTTGEVWFRSKNISSVAPNEIARMGIGHVPEGRQLFPAMSVLENFLMGAHLKRNKTQIQNSLEKVFTYFPALRQKQKQRVRSLSGGEQQMVAIGRSLMGSPSLLMLDEPTFGLAPLMVNNLGNIIGNIHHSGTAILLVEQNAHLALNLANYGYVFEVGHVTLQGDVTKLKNEDTVKDAYLGRERF